MIPNVDVFTSIGGKVTVLSAYHKVSIKGSAFMIMPLAVAFFMVLAVMLGTVHERKREINIFSSVGLSPRHVAGMFFIESIVYAGIASVFGYFLGIILLYVFRDRGPLPAGLLPELPRHLRHLLRRPRDARHGLVLGLPHVHGVENRQPLPRAHLAHRQRSPRTAAGTSSFPSSPRTFTRCSASWPS